MRFYPGLTKNDILALTPQETKYYLQAMEIVEARERLRLMDALQYVKIQDRHKKEKKHRDLYRKAYPDNFDKAKILKTTELRLF